MAFIILLLNSCLIFIGTAANFNENAEKDYTVLINHRLSNHTETIIPSHYNILLTPHIEEDNANGFKFSGDIDIVIEILYPTQSISLHAQQPYVKINQSILVKINDNQVKTKLNLSDQSNTMYYSTNYAYQSETQIFTIYFDTAILKGNYILKMTFTSTLDSNEGGGFFQHKMFQTNEDKYET
ncbi:hypothetical protein CAJAP_00554 [Camponotus japonicus]